MNWLHAPIQEGPAPHGWKVFKARAIIQILASLPSMGGLIYRGLTGEDVSLFLL